MGSPADHTASGCLSTLRAQKHKIARARRSPPGYASSSRLRSAAIRSRPRAKPRATIASQAAPANTRSPSSATTTKALRSTWSWGRRLSSRASSLRAMRWPVRATGTVRLGSTSNGSAAVTISRSMPEEAKSRSTTFVSTPGGRSRTVASLPTAACSTAAPTPNPALTSARTKRSASRSSRTATTRSMSRVKRGSVLTDTARPPTNAKAAPRLWSSVAILASAEPRLVTRPAMAGAGRGSLPTPRRVDG